ncbi:hypothetical protein D046_3003B, partial [Vibrio parahaemolyticus V-223/04]
NREGSVGVSCTHQVLVGSVSDRVTEDVQLLQIEHYWQGQ